jgi:hypothetical protein
MDQTFKLSKISLIWPNVGWYVLFLLKINLHFLLRKIGASKNFKIEL